MDTIIFLLYTFSNIYQFVYRFFLKFNLNQKHGLTINFILNFKYSIKIDFL